MDLDERDLRIYELEAELAQYEANLQKMRERWRTDDLLKALASYRHEIAGRDPTTATFIAHAEERLVDAEFRANTAEGLLKIAVEALTKIADGGLGEFGNRPDEKARTALSSLPEEMKKSPKIRLGQGVFGKSSEEMGIASYDIPLPERIGSRNEISMIIREAIASGINIARARNSSYADEVYEFHAATSKALAAYDALLSAQPRIDGETMATYHERIGLRR